MVKCCVLISETEVTITPSLVLHSSGYNSRINCTVKSSEFVNITWMKDGVILEDKDDLNITYMFINNSSDHRLSVSTIIFISPELSYSGSYECKSSRTNINGSHLIDTATYFINVSLPEEVEFNETTLVNETTTATAADSYNLATEKTGTLHHIRLLCCHSMSVTMHI